STGDFTVTVIDDALLENTETVKAKIANPSNGSVTIGTPLATANITESGATATLPTQTNGVEGGANIIYRLTLNKQNVTGSPITFSLVASTLTSGGTATSGSDYTAFGGTANISVANGPSNSSSTGDFTVTVIDDALLESTETVKAKISSPSNASVTIGTALA